MGQGTPEGVTLISATGERGFDIEGKKETLKLGEPFSAPSSNSPGSVTITADAQGHHWANGIVNGRSIRFLVDTGATLVAIPAAFAKTAGIEYPQRFAQHGANRQRRSASVPCDARHLAMGDHDIHQVNALVMEAGLDTALLGMSFLSRTDMKRDTNGMVPDEAILET